MTPYMPIQMPGSAGWEAFDTGQGEPGTRWKWKNIYTGQIWPTTENPPPDYGYGVGVPAPAKPPPDYSTLNLGVPGGYPPAPTGGARQPTPGGYPPGWLSAIEGRPGYTPGLTDGMINVPEAGQVGAPAGGSWQTRGNVRYNQDTGEVFVYDGQSWKWWNPSAPPWVNTLSRDAAWAAVSAAQRGVGGGGGGPRPIQPGLPRVGMPEGWQGSPMQQALEWPTGGGQPAGPPQPKPAPGGYPGSAPGQYGGGYPGRTPAPGPTGGMGFPLPGGGQRETPPQVGDTHLDVRGNYWRWNGTRWEPTTLERLHAPASAITPTAPAPRPVPPPITGYQGARMLPTQLQGLQGYTESLGIPWADYLAASQRFSPQWGMPEEAWWGAARQY